MLCFLVLACIYSCSDNDEFSHTYNADEPIVFTTFAPDSGGIREKFIIRGDNFGTDVSKIKVYFNEAPAMVMGSSGDVIYALVPRQPGEDCTIKVVVNDGSRSDSVIYDARTFKYIVAASVSTVVGKEDINGSGGYLDGTFAEAMLNDTRGVGVDNNGDLIIAETNAYRLRFASGNTVSTLGVVKDYIANVSFNADRTVAYTINGTNKDVRIYQMKQSTGYLPVEYIFLPKSQYDDFFYIGGLAVDEEENLYLVKRSDGTIVKFAANTKEMTYFDEKVPTKGVSSGYGVYNRHDKKLYFTCQNAHAIFRFNKDGSDIELFAGGFNIKGNINGNRLQARFNAPASLGVDSRGNIYVADRSNHSIKKIDTEGVVTTLAGTGKAGFTDGPPDEARFRNPIGLDVDKNDYIYIADKDNSRIRKIAVE